MYIYLYSYTLDVIFSINLLTIFLLPLECKVHAGGGLDCHEMLSSQQLEQCLVCSRCSVNCGFFWVPAEWKGSHRLTFGDAHYGGVLLHALQRWGGGSGSLQDDLLDREIAVFFVTCVLYFWILLRCFVVVLFLLHLEFLLRFFFF